VARPRGQAGAAGKRRTPLSAEAITKTAMRVADAEGLDAVSIRRVAAELGARPMSLYSHISSKDGLLGLMVDEVVGEILVRDPLPDHWREAVTILARSHYRTYLAHPWCIQLFLRPRESFGPQSTRLAKQNARTVASLRLEPAEMWLMLGTVNDWVLGYSLRATATPATGGLADSIDPADVVEFPALADLQDSLRERTSDERFERGLEIVLDGIERRFLSAEGADRDG
jgi:AcrR family transcriptional regulator